MNTRNINKELIEKYGAERESIKDLDVALNLINTYGDECHLDLCFDKSIRAKAYKIFKDRLKKLK